MDRKSLAIDPHKLEEEWLTQPLLYEEMAGNLANILRQRDEAKRQLEETLAEIRILITKDPTAYDLKDKPTVGSINDKAELTDDVQSAKKLVNNFNYQFQQAKGDIESVEMKKKALENLVQLYKGQYFSVPEEGKEVQGGKRFSENVKEKIVKEHREVMKEKKVSRRRGKFSEPITTKEERAEKTDDEKLERMSERSRKQVKEIGDRSEAKEGRESRRRRRKGADE